MESVNITSCPDGFVIPEDMHNPNNMFMNREISDCAFRCNRFVTYTDEEWNTLFTIMKICEILGFIAIALFFIIKYFGRGSRKYDYFVHIFVYLSLCIDIVAVISGTKPAFRTRCSTNSTFFVHPSPWEPCWSHAIGMGACYGMIMVTWTLQSLSIFLVTFFKWHFVNTTTYKYLCFGIIVLYPFWVVALLGERPVIRSDVTMYECSLRTAGMSPQKKFVISVISCGLFCMFCVFIKLLYTWATSFHYKVQPATRPVESSLDWSPEHEFAIDPPDGKVGSDTSDGLNASSGTLFLQTPELKKVSSFLDVANSFEMLSKCVPSKVTIKMQKQISVDRSMEMREGAFDISTSASSTFPSSDTHSFSKSIMSSIYFTLSFCLMYFTVLLSVFEPDQDAIAKSRDEWGKCVSEHYNGNDGSWVDACGKHQSVRISMLFKIVHVLTTRGQSVFIILLLTPRLLVFLEKYRNKRTAYVRDIV